jgi:hypothetical protein
MKPLRMRITHELLTAYDMLDKLDVLVSGSFLHTPSLEDRDREQSVQLRKPCHLSTPMNTFISLPGLPLIQQRI